MQSVCPFCGAKLHVWEWRTHLGACEVIERMRARNPVTRLFRS